MIVDLENFFLSLVSDLIWTGFDLMYRSSDGDEHACCFVCDKLAGVRGDMCMIGEGMGEEWLLMRLDTSGKG